MIQILQLPLGPLQTNCYLIACDQTNDAAVIDPSWNGRFIAETATEKGWQISKILLTHAHFDHVGGLAELKRLVDVPVYIHAEALPMLQQTNASAQLFGMEIEQPSDPEQLLVEGDVVTVGNSQLDVLFTPGHAPGHISFYLKAQNILFDGDVLFQQSIGRTDLPGGDMGLLLQMIEEKFLILPDETAVLSGHGPATTIGQEKQWNPFLR
jgi:glyoxylase-like metal-dependent hydrolase (beta-lactamase superfamily II)